MVDRKWSDAQLQAVAEQTTLDIMEDIASLGSENVDPMEWAWATAEIENIHDKDREVFFAMLGMEVK